MAPYDLTRPQRTGHGQIGSDVGPYMSIQDHTEPYNTKEGHTRPYRTMDEHTGPYRAIQDLT